MAHQLSLKQTHGPPMTLGNMRYLGVQRVMRTA
jgi:hypothetical protein